MKVGLLLEVQKVWGDGKGSCPLKMTGSFIFVNVRVRPRRPGRGVCDMRWIGEFLSGLARGCPLRDRESLGGRLLWSGMGFDRRGSGVVG